MSGRDLSATTGGGEVVVLLHGGSAGQSPWSDTGNTWADTAARLEGAGYTVVAPDRPGHGASPATAIDDLSFEHECSVVAEAIAAAGGRAHVVGHAEAGITALLLAQRDRQKKLGIEVLSATVVGGYGAEPTADGPERVILSDPPVEAWSAASQRWAVRRLTHAGDTAGERYDDARAGESSRAAAALLEERGNSARVAGFLLRAKSSIFAWARDRGYDVPISLTWGMEDPLSETPRAVEFMKVLASTTAHLELNLVDCAGHFVHRERADEFERLLLGFLARSSAQ
ncbi:alpha/beta fold hydrolase [Leucobacter sp. USHLN153]|uniref:alpha/beta fold hydrolase n=1 Tax=Leucobacter sp. USHLN153 TaxID=3081268 RepID=UPI003016B3C1